MRVLSIDFDFFQDIPMDVISKYPDGIDLPQDISNLVWAARINNYSDSFQKVEFDEDNFFNLLSVLGKQKHDIPVCICNSHIMAYFFIHELIVKTLDTKINLTNIDLHHDMDNANEYLDCGNWIGFLLRETLVKAFRWVAKPLSQQMYELNDEEFHSFHGTLDFAEITKGYDAIFICRSDPWLLPRFDGYFDKLVSFCQSHFSNIKIQEVDKPRRLPKIKSR